MTSTKISLLGIYMFILYFLLLAAVYDAVRCCFNLDYGHFTANSYQPGTIQWYIDLLAPNIVLFVFCLPKLFFMKKFVAAGEGASSIWNPIFYFAFAVLVTVGVLAVIEIFDTRDIEIVQHV